MKLLKTLLLAAAVGALPLLPALSAAHAQTFPTKPISLIIPFPPGGPTDAMARTLAAEIKDALGQPVIVENRAGAGGNIGADFVARAPADGHTLLFGTSGPLAINSSLYRKISYDPVTSFTPVIQVGHLPNILVVNPSVPAKDIKELLQLIRDNPGKYSFAGPGVGSTPHLAGEQFRLVFNLDLVHVPFTGAGPAIQSTIGGHTPIAFTALPPALAAVKDGKLRMLGVATPQRAASVPEVATFAEQGITDQDSDTLTGLVAPAGTPKEVVELLQKEIAKAIAQPDVREKLATLGFVPVANKPEEFGARIKSEIEKWGKVVRDAKLKVE